MPAPIIVFAYKRPELLRRCLEALELSLLSGESEVYVYVDGPKSESEKNLVLSSIEVAKHPWNFLETHLIAGSKNLGLANSIRNGVSEVLRKHDNAIILEDDLIVHKCFLNFMNESLERYKANPSVASIQGFSIIERINNECYFLRGADCWGWATWRDQWEGVIWNSNELYEQIKQSGKISDFNYKNSYNMLKLLKLNSHGDISSWAVEWQASMFMQNRYSLYPPFNLVANLGNGPDATHTTQDLSEFNVDPDRANWDYPNEVFMDPVILKLVGDQYLKFYQRPIFVSKIIRFFKNQFDGIFGRHFGPKW